MSAHELRQATYPSRMNAIALLLLLTVLLTGCTHDRFAVTNHATRIFDSHAFVADVTCTSADFRNYKTLRDEFHLKAMPPRIRWTAAFRIDHVIKGDVSATNFRLIEASDSASPFRSGIWFQTNVSYRVGFDCIADGKVRGLEIFTSK